MRLNHYIGYVYEGGRRCRRLTIHVAGDYPIDTPGWKYQEYEIRVYPYNERRLVTFEWQGPRQYKPPFVLHAAMAVRVDVQDGVVARYTSHHTHPYHSSPFPIVTGHPGRVEPPAADLGGLFEIAKLVAAGRVEPLMLLGWMEDHLPEPWNLLASPTPVEAFRALSPIPLFGV